MNIIKWLDDKQLKILFYTLVVTILVAFIFPILNYFHTIIINSYAYGYKHAIGVPWLIDFDVGYYEFSKLLGLYTWAYLYVFVAIFLSLISILSFRILIKKLNSISSSIIFLSNIKNNKEFKEKFEYKFKNIVYSKNSCKLTLGRIFYITLYLFFFILPFVMWIVFYVSSSIKDAKLNVLVIIIMTLLVSFISSIVFVSLRSWTFYARKYTLNYSNFDHIIIFSIAFFLLLLISLIAIGILSGQYDANNFQSSILNSKVSPVALKSNKMVYILQCQEGSCIGFERTNKSENSSSLRTVLFEIDEIANHSI